MRQAIKMLNKAAVAEATGISYSRLRKYAAELLAELTPEEQKKIYDFLLALAEKFKN